MGSALHIDRQAGVPELSRWFFIVAVGNSSAIGTVEVRVVHSDLSEICVRWTAKRVWKNEMQKYARGRHMSFSGTDRFWGWQEGGRTCVVRAARRVTVLITPALVKSRLASTKSLLPPSLSPSRCLASLPTPRKPKPATWLHSPAARACASSSFPQRTCTLPARSILYELYVLSVMACFTLVRTG